MKINVQHNLYQFFLFLHQKNYPILTYVNKQNI